MERRAESEHVPKYFFPFALMRSARLLAVLEPPVEVVVVVVVVVVVIVVVLVLVLVLLLVVVVGGIVV